MTYPIILAHGVCRFDKIWSDALDIDNNDNEELDNLHYFKGIRTMLSKNGFKAYHSNVGWATDVDSRAIDLKKDVLKVLEKENCEKVRRLKTCVYCRGSSPPTRLTIIKPKSPHLACGFFCRSDGQNPCFKKS